VDTTPARDDAEQCTCGQTARESELCDCDATPCPVNHAAEERRERYVDAILAALARDTSRGPNWHAAADAAIAKADQEREKDVAQWGADLEAADTKIASLRAELKGAYAVAAHLRKEAAEVRAATLTDAADELEHCENEGGDCMCAAVTELRRMAAAARPDVDMAEVIARCPEHGTRTETYAECRCAAAREAAAQIAAAARPDTTPAPQPCPPGCIACATDESHDPARPDTTGA
jgi:hypothetical protein